MNYVSFDQYLAKKEVVDFEKVDYLPIIFSEQCKLDDTWVAMLTLATNSDDPAEHSIILKRLKENNYDGRMANVVGDTYTDSKICTLYQSLGKEDELMADVMDMRIARGANFSPTAAVKNSIKEEMNSDDSAFAQRVADELLYYTDYGSFMVTIEDFEQTQLVSNVAKILTLGETKLEKKIELKDQMLLYFDGIIDTSGLEPKDVLKQIQDCTGEIAYMEFSEWPIALFESCKEMDLEVAKGIDQHAHDYLREVSSDKWEEQL